MPEPTASPQLDPFEHRGQHPDECAICHPATDATWDALIADAQDEEDLEAAGLLACWTGAAERWAANLDQAVKASSSVADLLEFGFLVDAR